MHLQRLQASQAKILSFQEVGHAALNFTQFDMNFWHGVYHAPPCTYRDMYFRYYYFFLREV